MNSQAEYFTFEKHGDFATLKVRSGIVTKVSSPIHSHLIGKRIEEVINTLKINGVKVSKIEIRD